MSKQAEKEIAVINRSEGILRGLLRFNRVNNDDMPLIAEMIGEFLRTRIDFYGDRFDEKTVATIIESMDYFHNNKK